MRARSLSLLILVAFLVACASGGGTSGRPASVSKPELNAELPVDPFFGSGNTAPANIEIRVTNTATVPITVRRIEVDSPSMSEWGIPRQSRDFNKTIQPGATENITFFATARTLTLDRREPLTFRVQFYFEAGEATWREILNSISTMPPR